MEAARGVRGADGRRGTGGDGGQGTSADLGQPSAIVVDSNSNLLIGDPQFGTIRKVTPAGIISTIAGSGTSGYSGDGVFALTARIKAATPETMGAEKLVPRLGLV